MAASRRRSGRKGRWGHFPRADVLPSKVSRPALLAVRSSRCDSGTVFDYAVPDDAGYLGFED
jgi:hypothetical protein